VRECLASARIVSGELRVRGDDGVERSLRYRMQLALDEHGEAVALEGVLQDVSEWRRSEARAAFLADHDPATGLPNRAGFVAHLASALETARGSGANVAVMALGLDSVDRVAETLGREAADALLREAAVRVAAATGVASGALARSAASQLALIAPSEVGSAPEALARLAGRALDAFEAPLRLESHEVMLSASAGIARSPDDGADAETVLRAAERALASARRGSARIALHSEATSADAFRRFTLASRLRGALARGELALHYQPKLSLSTGEIVGFEGLVRWQEPELGLLAPGDFIPLAEESGLIVPLGDWVTREACRQSVAWRDAGLGEVPIAVNLSAKQFRREGVAARVAKILRETGASPRQLGVEITESVLLEDAGAAIRELERLRALGIELALDDFGTGFSSLSYLRTLPVQIVKIDRAFIAEIATREDAAALAAGIVALAKSLWLRVVAEGVERDEQRALVAIWGCDEAQGFLFSRPVPAAEAERLWRTRGRGSATQRSAG
jgi:diguanylate cyclase (GGDEF)-like protein